MAFLAFVHLALCLALSLSPGNSLVSSWCDHSMLAVSLYSHRIKVMIVFVHFVVIQLMKNMHYFGVVTLISYYLFLILFVCYLFNVL